MTTAADSLSSPGAEPVLPTPPYQPEYRPEYEPGVETHAVHILRDQNQLFERIRHREDLTGLIRQGLLVAVLGSAVFGLSLGTYAQTFSQVLASALKLPILLLGATVICFPAFHLLQSWLAKNPLDFKGSVALQSISLASVALVWGSLAPAVIFLVASTQHYRLCQFLAVGVGAAGGLVGLSVLSSGYWSLCEDLKVKTQGGLLRRTLKEARALAAYLFLYGCVGGQMSWILRPFIGSPTMQFQIFRAPDPEAGNFFLMLLRMLGLV